MNYAVPLNVPSRYQRPVIDIRNQLPVNPRYSWISRNGVRDLRKLTTLAIHHDAISKSASKPYGDVEFEKRIALSHIRSTHNLPQGDPGHPYHIHIRNGNTYITNEFEAFTYGVGNNNNYTVHISVSGNYAGVDSLSAEDRDALYGAILMVKSLVPSIKEIKGHKEFPGAKTACPGFNMDQVRSDILDIEEQISSEMDSLPVRAYNVTARVKQLGQRLSDPQWGASARQKLGWMVDWVEGSYSPETVVAVIGELYKLKQFDKIVELESNMREKGIL